MQQLVSCVDDDDRQRSASLIAGLIADGLIEQRGQRVRLSGDT
jgi:hypothetical protein